MASASTPLRQPEPHDLEPELSADDLAELERRADQIESCRARGELIDADDVLA